MEAEYHIQICQRALEHRFSARALEIVVNANLGQDELRGQFGHPEFHFDGNAFDESYAYMDKQRDIILSNLSEEGESTLPTWEAFGRLIHTAQDFYAHSNYLQLWADSYPKGEIPPLSEVDGLIPIILNHPELITGELYLWDYLAYVPGLYRLAMRILPEDSHGHMNLDHPERGPLFPHAVEAAVQRTIHEFDLITSHIQKNLGGTAVQRFTDC